jgi:DNA-binding response OmpR family regulator
MLAAIRTAISPFGQPREPNASSTQFLDEDLASVPVSGIPEEFRKLSRFLPVIVLIPKPAVRDKTTHRESSPNKSVACLTDSRVVSSPLAAAKAWFKHPSASDAFEFGEVIVCFSAMEIHRNGRPVTLTCKEFQTLEYLIKNPRRVISRDELLNEVWGYECYPCTRTVDNHILRLRQKLETEPARPKHFHTVHGAGYKFLP